jgi:hypothetical protein
MKIRLKNVGDMQAFCLFGNGSFSFPLMPADQNHPEVPYMDTSIEEVLAMILRMGAESVTNLFTFCTVLAENFGGTIRVL